MKIAILGSTGSIGKSTLDVIRKDKKNFEVVFLSANNNYKKLIQQAKEFNVKNIGNIEKIKEPILPEIVLFGLILVNFLPAMVFPKT